MDTPGKPTVQIINSSSVAVTVPDIDDDATDVKIYLTGTSPVVSEFLAGTFAKSNAPFIITGLRPASFYTAKAVATDGVDDSAKSDASDTFRTSRLFVYGHISTSAVGVTGCDVDIGRLPAADRLFPTELIGGPYTNRNFDANPVSYNGKLTARMVIQIAEQPSPEIHTGQLMSMVIRKKLPLNQERWSKILYDAIVVEDAGNYTPPTTGYANRYFIPNYFEPAFFTDKYFG